MKTTKKNAKKEILENWYGIDYLFFGDKNPKKYMTRKGYNVYTETKGYFLRNLEEMYKMIGYKSMKNYASLKEMADSIKEDAQACLEITVDSMKNGKYNNILTESTNLVYNNQNVPSEMAKNIAVPRMTMALVLDHFTMYSKVPSVGQKKINSLQENTKFNIMLDAHDKLRDTLVEVVFRGMV